VFAFRVDLQRRNKDKDNTRVTTCVCVYVCMCVCVYVCVRVWRLGPSEGRMMPADCGARWDGIWIVLQSTSYPVHGRGTLEINTLTFYRPKLVFVLNTQATTCLKTCSTHHVTQS
jgi:hypothetical protein